MAKTAAERQKEYRDRQKAYVASRPVFQSEKGPDTDLSRRLDAALERIQCLEQSWSQVEDLERRLASIEEMAKIR